MISTLGNSEPNASRLFSSRFIPCRFDLLLSSFDACTSKTDVIYRFAALTKQPHTVPYKFKRRLFAAVGFRDVIQ